MYISYGWPKVLAALEPGSHQEDVVYIAIDQDYFVLVSTSRIQVWTGGQHRVKLGTFTREEESIRADGLNRKAFWSSAKRNLAILVRSRVAGLMLCSSIVWPFSASMKVANARQCTEQGWIIRYSKGIDWGEF